MPYRYTCNTCPAHGGVHGTKLGASRDQAAHRRSAHAGMTPASGDGVRYAPPSHRGVLIVLGVLLFLTVIKHLTGVAPDDIARWVGLI